MSILRNRRFRWGAGLLLTGFAIDTYIVLHPAAENFRKQLGIILMCYGVVVLLAPGDRPRG